MKFVPIVSSVYFSSTVVSSIVYPSLFLPLTIAYVVGIGEYEFLNFIDRRLVE